RTDKLVPGRALGAVMGHALLNRVESRLQRLQRLFVVILEFLKPNFSTGLILLHPNKDAFKVARAMSLSRHFTNPVLLIRRPVLSYSYLRNNKNKVAKHSMMENSPSKIRQP